MTTPKDRPIGSIGWSCLFGAWLIALAATLGAVYIGEIFGLTPCQLCWYQRIAMFPLALILGVACLRNDAGVGCYALPLALAGGGVALWHSLLYVGWPPTSIEPCQAGVSCTGAGMTFMELPLPMLSLGAFLAISVLLLAGKRKSQ
ncbi:MULTISPECIES: disulfide bond formation protein B [Alphaproteobacteria]|jgi:disulfide bond formation protein DsbB|uniref:Disulfide bond formation protein n=1 Tax=Oceanibaculum indicum P24 TaxID=1207063 RepID=K2JBB7_9PROT|nr:MULTISPECIES: disulfide bond formation protein B [Alphaproteobacteria]EKE67884.1 disulfide bond formation protein [Oceanibaculum indicum P24]MBC7286158.1 disulfide bond formation protein B [Hoeflea sp.]MCH2396190.1 disulfide bond formation protein B [Oceanibaculum sp.]|tara:strand:- start:280 stop:717 length:438 start_codon:yes stop_codon:yes gene_type:complete